MLAEKRKVPSKTPTYKKGGAVKGSASKRADGIAQKATHVVAWSKEN